jgi:hypothetical protein
MNKSRVEGCFLLTKKLGELYYIFVYIKVHSDIFYFSDGPGGSRNRVIRRSATQCHFGFIDGH